MTPEDKKKLKLAAIPVLGAIGAWLYRLRGGGPGPKLPRPIDQILFSLFPCIVLPALLVFEDRRFFALESWPWITGWLAATLWAVAWECTGHGGFFYHPKGQYKKIVNTVTDSATEREPERIEFLIRWLNGKVSDYAYSTIGMALTGLVVTIAPGILVAASGHVIAGALLGASGLLKPPAYMIGYALSKSKATEIGEWTSGGFRWAAAAAIMAFLWG